jgi:hypothetical protein
MRNEWCGMLERRANLMGGGFEAKRNTGVILGIAGF